MQEIISQLTEIEKTANSIVEEAKNKKADIFDEMEQKKKERKEKREEEMEAKRKEHRNKLLGNVA